MAANKSLLLCLLIAAIGNVIYHLGQKSIHAEANPMSLLMMVYALAFVMAAVCLPFFKSANSAPWAAQLFTWPMLALALGVLLIEIGFLLAYRAGGSVQWSGAAVNGAAALILLPIAMLAFGERFSLHKLGGVALVIGGLYLTSRK